MWPSLKKSRWCFNWTNGLKSIKGREEKANGERSFLVLHSPLLKEDQESKAFPKPTGEDRFREGMGRHVGY